MHSHSDSSSIQMLVWMVTCWQITDLYSDSSSQHVRYSLTCLIQHNGSGQNLVCIQCGTFEALFVIVIQLSHYYLCVACTAFVGDILCLNWGAVGVSYCYFLYGVL